MGRVKAVADGVVDVVRGRAKDKGQNTEFRYRDMVQKLTPVKVFIMVVVGAVVFVGLKTVIETPVLLRMRAFCDMALAISPLFGLLITIVGGSGIVKNTRWRNERSKPRYDEE